MSEASKIKANADLAFWQANPALAVRNIDESTWSALCNSIYPGAKPESILMAIDYCQSRGLDIMLKPVHIVPMSVKNQVTGNYEFRDVPMPGVGLYRIQAERSGNYAGADAPEMGPDVTKTFKKKGCGDVTVTFPEWCKYTVHKLIAGDRIVSYTALEYWEENYATDGKDSTAPNSMWLKRPRAQLAKCAEAQALRKAWPEIGQEPTAEEMYGKEIDIKDVTPATQIIQQPAQQIGFYPADKFESNMSAWVKAVADGKHTPDSLLATISTRGALTEEQKARILNINKTNE